MNLRSIFLTLMLLSPTVHAGHGPIIDGGPTADGGFHAVDRPNIVFAFADDWGRYASIYGQLEPGGISDILHTPNIDRIATEGALFRHAFVNAPSCTPCRSSLLSGQHFWRTGRGAILQGAIWDEQIPSYPLLLEKSGYHIGFSDKVWSPGQPVDAPYGSRRNRYNKAGGKHNSFSQYLSRNKGRVPQAKQELLAGVRRNFSDFLNERKPGQPVCYWWGPTNCHRKWVRGSGQEFWNLNPDDLQGKLPAFLPDVPTVREDVADYLGEVMAFDAGLGQLLAELQERNELDRTIIVVSGDHGAPGFPNGKCNLYDFGVHVPLMVRYPKSIPANRVIDDFVTLPDLAPTFLEFANVQVPQVMTARSLKPILESEQAGMIDPTRDSVFFGRERHVAAARTEYRPYPQRAIRTKNFLYIRNYKPERWPMGTAPGFGSENAAWPSDDQLTNNTFAAFADMDASPTKSWVIQNCRTNPSLQKYFQYAFGKRPAEELYEVSTDSDQIYNVAQDPKFANIKADLAKRLTEELQKTGDPRRLSDSVPFEKTPFTDPPPPRRKKP